MKDFSFEDSIEETGEYNSDPGEKQKIIKFVTLCDDGFINAYCNNSIGWRL